MALHIISEVSEILTMIFSNLKHSERGDLWKTCRLWCSLMRDTPPTDPYGLLPNVMAGPWYTKARQEWIDHLCDSSSILSVLTRLDPSQTPVTYPPAIGVLKNLVMRNDPAASIVIRYLDTSIIGTAFLTPNPDILVSLLGSIKIFESRIIYRSELSNPFMFYIGLPENKRIIAQWLANNGLVTRYYEETLGVLRKYNILNTNYAILYQLILYFPYLIEVLPPAILNLNEVDRKPLKKLASRWGLDKTLVENIVRFIYAK